MMIKDDDKYADKFYSDDEICLKCEYEFVKHKKGGDGCDDFIPNNEFDYCQWCFGIFALHELRDNDGYCEICGDEVFERLSER